MRPLLIGEGAEDELLNGDILSWIAEAWGAGPVGVGTFAVFVLFIPALGLFNWTESFRVPAVWLVLMTPSVSMFLPVPVIWRLAGLVTTALAMLFVGLWLYWRRL